MRVCRIIGDIRFLRRRLKEISSSTIWFSWDIIFTIFGGTRFVIIWVTTLAVYRQINNSSWTDLSVWFWMIGRFANRTTFIICWWSEWLDRWPVGYIVVRLWGFTVIEAYIHDRRSQKTRMVTQRLVLMRGNLVTINVTCTSRSSYRWRTFILK